MPKAVDIDDFAAKLNLVCKRLNWSRAKLAQQIGMDKSLAGRWLAGASRPTGNSLMRLNDAVAKSLPDFAAATWDLTSAALAARLGIAPPPVAGIVAEPANNGPLSAADVLAGMKSFRRAAEDIDVVSRIYAGFYRFWMASFANDGAILLRHARIWRDGNALRLEVVGGEANYAGGCMVVGERLHAIFETPTFSALSFTILSGPRGLHPKRLCGLTLFDQNSHIRGGVAAAPTVIEFIQPMSDDGEADERLWRKLERVRSDLSGEKEIRAAVPAEILAQLRPVVGASRADGTRDHIAIVRLLD